MQPYNLLCLGDSYTIGEMVPFKENFPNQTVNLLRKAGYIFNDPDIVAKTGWTTDELQRGMDQHLFKSHYDFVTLLIGVNNQYRGRTVEEYKFQFESLLKQAIHFAGNDPRHVIVLSIPDWGITPYAEGKNRNNIAQDIDGFNRVNQQISEAYKVHYINITESTREAVNDVSLLTSDGLHPSAKEYSKWAEKLAAIIKSEMKEEN